MIIKEKICLEINEWMDAKTKSSTFGQCKISFVVIRGLGFSFGLGKKFLYCSVATFKAFITWKLLDALREFNSALK